MNSSTEPNSPSLRSGASPAAIAASPADRTVEDLRKLRRDIPASVVSEGMTGGAARARALPGGEGMEEVGTGHRDDAGERGRVGVVAGGAFLALDRPGLAVPVAGRAPVGPGGPVAVRRPVARRAEERRLIELERRPVGRVQLVELVAVVAVVAVVVAERVAVRHGQQALVRVRDDDVAGVVVVELHR